MNNNAKYRKLIKRFWTDPRIQKLLIEQRFDEVMIIIYSITGAEACTYINLSGIYEIHRSSYENILHLGHNRVNDALHHINEKASDLMEYDFDNHVVFVKNFYKHNSSYKSDVSALIEDFDETFCKAPEFWAEFGQRYRKRLGKIYPVLQVEEQRKFLDRLFDLNNEIVDPKFQIKPISFKPLIANKSKLKSQRIIE